ncbi:SDR family NAD(P)-dependent oxidoreductase [Amycolatopsis sp. WQ 127309]|uniref:SDR family NAD(P)-dependent oxidoreductase n=1 Tax=Amycolatopsis sp. WQ 127309 TaxID=2932773 RepID=UPI001FF1330C|nr:SDR family oxidoreductase [Amycolatopsis sp. WQ 127309]UOZ03426.1 SDR family oxidoreductase [Amycolatopsis sp. WQ 127309]
MSSAHTRSTVALITGGSRGVGRDTALRLAQDGTDVVITYRSHPGEAHAVVAELRALGRKAEALHLDVADLTSFPAFTAALRAALRTTWDRADLDHLVNNAGHGSLVPFAEVTEADFDHLMNVHLKGVFFLTQQLLPLLRDGGRIVNVSSALTRFSNPGMSAYAIMKAGVEMLTRYLALELGPRGITANAVAPGATATDFAGGYAGSPQGREAIAGITALGRTGEPGDIGGVISALLDDRTGWITGQRVEASGGALL